MSDILILPKPKSPETKRKPKKPSLNKKMVGITDDAVYDSMKLEAAEKEEAEKEKERKRRQRRTKLKKQLEESRKRVTAKKEVEKIKKMRQCQEGSQRRAAVKKEIKKMRQCQTEIRRTPVKQQPKVTRLCARSVDLYMRKVTIYGYVVMVVMPGMIRSVHL